MRSCVAVMSGGEFVGHVAARVERPASPAGEAGQAVVDPRSRARKMKRRRKGRQKFNLRNPARTVALCGPCHRNVHVSIGNAELQRGYDPVEAIRDDPGVWRFTEWVKDKSHGGT